MDPQLIHRSVVLLALTPLVAWIGAFGMLYAAQRTYPTPRSSVRSRRSTSFLLRAGSLAACLAWLGLLLALE